MRLPDTARSYRRDGEVEIKGLLRSRTPQEIIYEELFRYHSRQFDIETFAMDRSLIVIAREIGRLREMDFWNVKVNDPGLWVNGKQVLKF